MPNTGRSWRFGRYNNTYHYEYDSLSDRRDALYRSRFSGKEELLRVYKLKIEESRKVKEEQISKQILNYVSALEDNTDICITCTIVALLSAGKNLGKYVDPGLGVVMLFYKLKKRNIKQ